MSWIFPIVDDAVGQVRETAVASQEIQVFTTDHGDHLGEHRQLFKGAEQYQQITHVLHVWTDAEEKNNQLLMRLARLSISVSLLERAQI